MSSTEDGKSTQTNFITIQVFDKNLKEIAENLEANDKVAVEGKIMHMPYIFPDGKKKFTGFIVANSIEKVQFQKAQQVDDAGVGHAAND